jgi:hypothetical protein
LQIKQMGFIMETENVDSVNNQKRPSGTEDAGEKKDFVQYETYSRVLSQHKKTKSENEQLAAELEAYRRKERELEEKRLSEQGEYKKLLELERKKRMEEEGKRQQYERDLLDAHKLNAVRERLPGKIKRPEYYSFIDVSKVVIDPETGIVDDRSVVEVVDGFVKEHGFLIERQGTRDLPYNAPGTGHSELTYEQWLKLPLKEQKARRKEVMDNWRKK